MDAVVRGGRLYDNWYRRAACDGRPVSRIPCSLGPRARLPQWRRVGVAPRATAGTMGPSAACPASRPTGVPIRPPSWPSSSSRATTDYGEVMRAGDLLDPRRTSSAAPVPQCADVVDVATATGRRFRRQGTEDSYSTVCAVLPGADGKKVRDTPRSASCGGSVPHEALQL